MRKNIKSTLADVRNDLELIKTIVMIREPATVQAAEAYDGLRKAVIATAADRTAHLQQLARLDAEVSRGASVAAIQQLLRDLLAETGLHRLTEVAIGAETAFDHVGGKGDTWQVIEPAYVINNGRGEIQLVRTGKAQRVQSGTDCVVPVAARAAGDDREAPPISEDRDLDAPTEAINEAITEAGR